MLNRYIDAFRTPTGEGLLNCYGLCAKEQKEWKYNFQTRIEADSIYDLIKDDLTEKDKEKIDINRRIFLGDYIIMEVTKEKILEIINDIVQNETINSEQYDEDLSKFGMDSIRFIQIIISLEDVFECEVPDVNLILTQMNTINKIYDVLISIKSNNK